MNVFARYTRRSLRRSPTRTLVTVVGIILSVALFTAVIEGAYSGLQYMIEVESEAVGAFHGFYRCLSPEEAAEVQKNEALSAAALWQDAGWALDDRVDGGYVFFADVDESFQDLVSVRMLDGRMPENEYEIAVPQSYSLQIRDGKGVQVGDTLTWTVGQRMGADGQIRGEETSYLPEEDPETLAGTEERTCTVVGIYENFSFEVTQDFPGSVFLTRGGGTGECRVYFALDRPERYREYVMSAGPWENPYAMIEAHSQLLRYYGVMGEDLRSVLYGLAGVLVFLIAFGSVSLIYNAFSISVKERTKQFGLLRSVGATKKQLRTTVLYEAMLLSAVGIPLGLAVGCLGIGVTLWALQPMFDQLFTGGYGLFRTQMHLAVSPGALALSALTALLTVLLSAWVPARRAAARPVMDAVRQTGDVKVSPREVRVSPLAGKLFGFEGLMAAKTMKRDRKGARATVFALFLSVTLFISATSLCAYVNDTVEILGWGDARTDLLVGGKFRSEPMAEDPERTLTLLSQAEGISDSTYYLNVGSEMCFDPGDLTKECRDFQERAHPFAVGEDGTLHYYCVVSFLEDGMFRDLCAVNELDPAPYFDRSSPLALFFNRFGIIYSDNGGARRWEDYTVLDAAAFPTEVRQVGENGETSLVCQVGAPITFQTFPFGETEPRILYPASMLEAVLGPAGKENTYYKYAFMVSDHAAAYEGLTERLGQAGLAPDALDDLTAYGAQAETVGTVVNVFAGSFIALIALIALANVFNTVSTGINLRRREFAMLRSLGLSRRGLGKMLRLECVAYGLRALAWGLPATGVLTWVIYKITSRVLTVSFYIPWYSVVAGIAGVFLMTFVAMGIAARGLRKGELAEDLRTEIF